MLSVWESNAAARRISRRTLLEVGSLALGSLSLADLLRLRAQAAAPAAPPGDTAVIQIFMGGGPSHIDMYDLKPDAPAEIRGEFRPISTSLPGVQISEHLPRLARALGHVALVRSVTHGNASHLPASHWMMTGYQPAPSTTANVNPVLRCARGQGPRAERRRHAGLRQHSAAAVAGRGRPISGAAYNPFTTESDPNAPNYAVQNLNLPRGIDAARLHDRQGLLRGLDRHAGGLRSARRTGRPRQVLARGAGDRHQLRGAAGLRHQSRRRRHTRSLRPHVGRAAAACSLAAWSRRASRSSRCSPAANGTRTSITFRSSRDNRCRRSTRAVAALVSDLLRARARPPRAGAGDRRIRPHAARSMRRPAATTGPERFRCCFPAAACESGRWSARPTAAPCIRSPAPIRPATCWPRSTISWRSTRGRNFTTAAAVRSAC